MRNKFSDVCYHCGKIVAPGEDYFERHKGGWRVQHVGRYDRARFLKKCAAHAPGKNRILRKEKNL